MPQRAKRKAARDVIDKRLDALRSDLDALQDDTKGLATDAAGVASDKAHEAIRAAEGLAHRALRLAEETASGLAGDVEHWTNDNLDSARDRVREQPLAALAMSLGIGLVLGVILLRG